MCSRYDKEYYAVDLLSDVLSQGNSSRLHKTLIKDQKVFSDLNAYVMGDFDKGLFVVSGKLSEGVTMEQADKAIGSELDKLKKELVGEEELTKVKNKVEATHTFGEVDILSKATNLAISELLGDANIINSEVERYLAVTSAQIQKQAQKVLRDENCSTLYYKSKNN